MSRIEKLIKELCPNGVEYKKVRDICKKISSGKNKDKKDIGEYPVYGSTGIIARTDNFVYNNKQILIARVGANAGYIHICEGKYDVSDNTIIINVDDNVNLSYIYYYLSNMNLNRFAKGGGQPLITATQIKELIIAIPPIEIQQEIVRILDNFTNLTAELQAELQARKEQYEYYRNNLLTFDKDNPNIKWMKMGDIARFTYGYTDKAKSKGDLRFIRISDILDNGCLNPKDAKYVSSSKETETYLLKKGDLLMARTGATYGKTLYVESEEPAVYASFLIKISLPSDLINSRYYWYLSKSSQYWIQANKYVSRGGQQQFNANALGRLEIPIPPIEEQERIVSILDKFEALVNDLSTGLPAEIAALQEQYEYYRNKLLTFERTA